MKFSIFLLSCLALSVRANSPPRGLCPRATQGIGICQFNPETNCGDDSSCNGGQICCPDGCNRSCQDPISQDQPAPNKKPGQCKIVPPKIGTCAINPETSCEVDDECIGVQKCCSDGCNRVCQEPVGVEPHQGISKPGQCKIETSFGTCAIDKNSCTKDNGCPGAQKCCSSGCNRVCKDPVGLEPNEGVIKPGQCENNAGKIGACVITANSCSRDAGCPGAQKCCSDGCNRVCKDPAAGVGSVGSAAKA